MKILSKPIDVVAVFIDGKKVPEPIRWRMKQKDGPDVIVKVERIYEIKPAKNGDMFLTIYCCQGRVDGVERRYELKFNHKTLKWVLWKM